MGEIGYDHQNTQAESCCCKFIFLTDISGKKCCKWKTHIGKQQTAYVIPGCPGGCKRCFVFRCFTNNTDQGCIGNIAEIPCHMRCDGCGNDHHCRNPFIITDTYEHECVQKRHHPRNHDQPGTITPPFLCFCAIDDSSVKPGQTCINNGKYGIDHTSYTSCKACQIRQKCHKVKCLDITHKNKSGITNTKEIFQGICKTLFLFRILFRYFIFTHFLSPFAVFCGTGHFHNFTLPLMITV